MILDSFISWLWRGIAFPQSLKPLRIMARTEGVHHQAAGFGLES